METRDIVKLATAGAMLVAVTVLAAMHVATWEQFVAVLMLFAPSPIGTFASMARTSPPPIPPVDDAPPITTREGKKP